jgi:hypothetical protein
VAADRPLGHVHADEANLLLAVVAQRPQEPGRSGCAARGNEDRPRVRHAAIVLRGYRCAGDGALKVLLVMEFLTEPERTVDGIADGSRIVLQATRTRESVRCGLGMYFVTLDAPELVAASERIVAEFELEWFFSIQFMGEKVIEINPRISTMMIQEDFNLPWLAVKRALGEASDDELRAVQERVRPGHTVLRFFEQVEFDP